MMKKSLTMDLTVFVVILAAAMSRLIPHWPNFTPVMAIALVGGVAFSNRALSVAVPLAVMLISDLALGAIMGTGYAFHDTQWAVYGSMAVISALGWAFRGRTITATTFLGGTIAGVGFFLVTNFAVWLGGGMYPATIEGLMACYAAGLVFYRDGGNFFLNGVVSTWMFSAAILGVIALARTNKSRSAQGTR